ncbi:MAG: type I DNA topoisomerase [Gemmatimonadota bacterium]|nr:type I DNA topoisomerase [Gemmatimonadota bacterium]MDH3427204.1 type I DNA topoisomerase [Gemmatimonadota bacterium]
MANNKKLVILESDKKARLIGPWLGEDYVVAATGGHIVDLPKKGLAVDVDGGYEPDYEIVHGKKKLITELKKAARSADQILIATDPDREGEAIGYHIARQLGFGNGDDGRFLRVTFNEVTKDAVLEAIADPGDLDLARVDAQQARRVLDRLVGYGLSPLLWKKISPVDPISRVPLSAGRVQSVAVRLIVERERERRRFRASDYWDLSATLTKDGREFESRLITLGGKRVATGSDFDPETGELKSADAVVLLDEQAAGKEAARLEHVPHVVAAVERRQKPTNPQPPFKTTTLQKAANARLKLSPRQTMRVAQRLYEAGLITYLRTDSTELSQRAVAAVRKQIQSRYGADYLSPKPRTHATKTKGAQLAHEAIRPSGTEMKTASQLGLKGVDAALYDLIWKRTMASQMAAQIQQHVSVTIAADDAEFRSNGHTLEFAGYRRAYMEGAADPESALGERDVFLPDLEVGDEPVLRQLEPSGHTTRPPARYTQGAFPGILEEEGIGRPSTTATIISTMESRGYVRLDGQQLVPTFLAFAVTALLEEHFEDLVDVGFTSEMERGLDRIAEGRMDWREYIDGFYRGVDGFEGRLADRIEVIDPRTASTLIFDDMAMHVRIGRYGPFLEHGTEDDPIRVSLPEDLAPADLTAEFAERLIEQKEATNEELGADPETGQPVFRLVGRFGPFVQLGEQEEDGPKPKRASLPEGMTLEAVDLDTALSLLALPRDLGAHPETGKPVRAGIGRYGPYVVHEKDFRSLQAGEDVLTVDFDRAMALLSEPKRGRKTQTALRDLGPHPADGEPIRLFEGRYGPYVKHGKVNASLPKGAAPDDMTIEQAVVLLTERAEKMKSGAGGGRRGRRKK